MLPDNSSLAAQRQELQVKRQQAGLWRELSLTTAQIPLSHNFSSNDYLALSQHPQVIQAYQQGLAEWGAGSGGSPLTTGYQLPHRALEEELCDWLGFEAVLLFSSGYTANLGLLQALEKLAVQPVLDKYCHASFYAGVAYPRMVYARKSMATNHTSLLRYSHNNLAHLANLLARKKPSQAQLIVSEGVFSMDGDQAPIDGLIQLKAAANQTQQETLLCLDDAHGIAALGEQGQGSTTAKQRQQIDFFTATFGKALGCHGAFLGTSKSWQHYFIQQLPSYIYSTAMPAAQALAIHQAIKIVREQAEYQQKLQHLVNYFQQQAKQYGIVLAPSKTAIQPLLIGCPQQTLWLSHQLAQAGFSCVAIRPPTVPQGSARLRFTLTLHHTEASIKALCQELAQCLKRLPHYDEN